MDTRIALLLLASISVTAGSNGSTVDEFEKAAAVSQKFLDLGCVLYDRLDRERCAYQAGAELVRADYAISDLD